MLNFYTHKYRDKLINAQLLEVPHETYQRPLIRKRAEAIAAKFDDCLVNDPKISWRDGHFYVFDGQYTLEAMKILNGSSDFLVRCRVFQGLTIEDEARLFALQFGESAPVPAGYLLRAWILAKDPNAIAFKEAVEAAGLTISYSQRPGKNRLGCIVTARHQFETIGRDLFVEAMNVLKEAWGGEAESFRSENVSSVCRFIHLYYGEIDRNRLVRKLSHVGPMHIYEQGSLIGSQLTADDKFLEQVYKLYTGTSTKYALPRKF